jgi:hypothetical protein
VPHAVARHCNAQITSLLAMTSAANGSIAALISIVNAGGGGVGEAIVRAINRSARDGATR